MNILPISMDDPFKWKAFTSTSLYKYRHHTSFQLKTLILRPTSDLFIKSSWDAS